MRAKYAYIPIKLTKYADYLLRDICYGRGFGGFVGFILKTLRVLLGGLKSLSIYPSDLGCLWSTWLLWAGGSQLIDALNLWKRLGYL